MRPGITPGLPFRSKALLFLTGINAQNKTIDTTIWYTGPLSRLHAEGFLRADVRHRGQQKRLAGSIIALQSPADPATLPDQAYNIYIVYDFTINYIYIVLHREYTIYVLYNHQTNYTWLNIMKEKKLIRKQLDKSLRQFQALGGTNPPRRGWIRAIRNALGMSARQLAARLNVSQQRVAQIEKQEIDGGLTIKAMRKTAEGLDCRFVYGFIPNGSLEEMVTNQAERVALRRLALASHTMSLEDQALSRQENEEILAEMIAELSSDPPANLWDEI